MVGGGDPFGSTGPRWSEIADFEPIFARGASAVTPSEKVQFTLIGSPHYALSNEPKMIIIRYPSVSQRGLKTQNGRFRYKIALHLKKVCYKVSLCVKTVSDKVVMHSLA